jgi:large subunit ribosomal protein L3
MSQEETSANGENKAAELQSALMKKVGMTRIFDSNGNHVPVTVLSIEKQKVTQVKSLDVDGYSALKIAFGEKRAKLINDPKLGELKKAGVAETFSKMTEVRLDSDEHEYSVGQEVSLENLAPGTLINVSGVTKGKGFAGVVKRYGFAGGPKSHGSKFHRTTGSIGNRATPGKVWKGKKMPGHMGCDRQTIKNLEVVEMNFEKGYMLVKGSVPGAKNSFVRVTKA